MKLIHVSVFVYEKKKSTKKKKKTEKKIEFWLIFDTASLRYLKTLKKFPSLGAIHFCVDLSARTREKAGASGRPVRFAAAISGAFDELVWRRGFQFKFVRSSKF